MRKLLYLFFIASSLLGAAQNLRITGPTEVCPGQTYTYTATTTSDGSFLFFGEDDGLPFNTGGVFRCNGTDRTATFTYTFNNTEGPANIEVQFKPRYFCFLKYDKDLNIPNA